LEQWLERVVGGGIEEDGVRKVLGYGGLEIGDLDLGLCSLRSRAACARSQDLGKTACIYPRVAVLLASELLARPFGTRLGICNFKCFSGSKFPGG
jgi:hypothetical protein